MDLTPWMTRWHMLPEKGGVILCAVSGGRDSICLLDYLHTLGQERGFTAAAGHLNHLMRPTASGTRTSSAASAPGGASRSTRNGPTCTPYAARGA